MPKTIEEKINGGRVYRQMEVRALDENESQYTVEGYATTFDQPYELYSEPGYRFMEQVSRSAFDNTDMSDVIMQFDHSGKVYARKSNGTLLVDPDEHGLKVKAYLGGTEGGRQLYEEIKGGYVTKMSFGFTVNSDELAKEETEALVTITRTITGIKKLYDVSAVSLPANDTTAIYARNYGEGVIAEVKEEIRLATERRARKEELLKSIMKEV